MRINPFQFRQHAQLLTLLYICFSLIEINAQSCDQYLEIQTRILHVPAGKECKLQYSESLMCQFDPQGQPLILKLNSIIIEGTLSISDELSSIHIIYEDLQIRRTGNLNIQSHSQHKITFDRILSAKGSTCDLKPFQQQNKLSELGTISAALTTTLEYHEVLYPVAALVRGKNKIQTTTFPNLVPNQLLLLISYEWNFNLSDNSESRIEAKQYVNVQKITENIIHLNETIKNSSIDLIIPLAKPHQGILFKNMCLAARIGRNGIIGVTFESPLGLRLIGTDANNKGVDRDNSLLFPQMNSNLFYFPGTTPSNLISSKITSELSIEISSIEFVKNIFLQFPKGSRLRLDSGQNNTFVVSSNLRLETLEKHGFENVNSILSELSLEFIQDDPKNVEINRLQHSKFIGSKVNILADKRTKNHLNIHVIDCQFFGRFSKLVFSEKYNYFQVIDSIFDGVQLELTSKYLNKLEISHSIFLGKNAIDDLILVPSQVMNDDDDDDSPPMHFNFTDSKFIDFKRTIISTIDKLNSYHSPLLAPNHQQIQNHVLFSGNRIHSSTIDRLIRKKDTFPSAILNLPNMEIIFNGRESEAFIVVQPYNLRSNSLKMPPNKYIEAHAGYLVDSGELYARFSEIRFNSSRSPQDDVVADTAADSGKPVKLEVFSFGYEAPHFIDVNENIQILTGTILNFDFVTSESAKKNVLIEDIKERYLPIEFTVILTNPLDPNSHSPPDKKQALRYKLHSSTLKSAEIQLIERNSSSKSGKSNSIIEMKSQFDSQQSGLQLVYNKQWNVLEIIWSTLKVTNAPYKFTLKLSYCTKEDEEKLEICTKNEQKSACPDGCEDCQNNKCKKCSDGLLEFNKVCVTSCDQGYFEKDKKCYPCLPGCAHCIDEDTCLACYSNNNKNLDEKCLPCAVGTFSERGGERCQSCAKHCKTCNGNGKYDCMQCESGFSLFNGECVYRETYAFLGEKCDDYELCKLEKECLRENDQCVSCKLDDQGQDSFKFVCAACKKGYVYSEENHKCEGCLNSKEFKAQRIERSIYDVRLETQCRECHGSCKSNSGCFGPTKFSCVECADGYSLDSSTGACEDCSFFCQRASLQNSPGLNVMMMMRELCVKCSVNAFRSLMSCDAACQMGISVGNVMLSQLCLKSSDSSSNNKAENAIVTAVKMCENSHERCLKCNSFTYLQADGTCVSECGKKAFVKKVDGQLMCIPCNSKCNSCQVESYLCTYCFEEDENLPINQQRTCVNQCPFNSHFLDEIKQKCVACHEKCIYGCNGATDANCFEREKHVSIVEAESSDEMIYIVLLAIAYTIIGGALIGLCLYCYKKKMRNSKDAVSMLYRKDSTITLNKRQSISGTEIPSFPEVQLEKMPSKEVDPILSLNPKADT